MPSSDFELFSTPSSSSRPVKTTAGRNGSSATMMMNGIASNPNTNGTLTEPMSFHHHQLPDVPSVRGLASLPTFAAAKPNGAVSVQSSVLDSQSARGHADATGLTSA